MAKEKKITPKKKDKEVDSKEQEIQQMFEDAQKSRIQDLISKVKSEPDDLAKELEAIRRRDFETFQRKIVSLTLPGPTDEKTWEEIHNNPDIYIDSENEIQLREEIIIIIRYKEKRKKKAKKEKK